MEKGDGREEKERGRKEVIMEGCESVSGVTIE